MKAAAEFNLFVSSLFWKHIYMFFIVAISSYFLELLKHMEYKYYLLRSQQRSI